MASGNYGWSIGENASREFLANEGGNSVEPPQELAEHQAIHPFPRPIPHQGHYWCDFSGDVPPGAVRAGVDKDGSDIYVGRAFHQGEILPAKAIPASAVAYVAWGGEEHAKNEFEILCKGSCVVVWQESSNGSVPPNAVPIGRTSENERLFLGRVFHDGITIPGKIHPSHGVCYVPYSGSELSFNEYEALILLQQ